MKTYFARLTLAAFVAGFLFSQITSPGHCAETSTKATPDTIVYDGIYPGWPWISASPDGTFYCVLREGVRHGYSAEGRIMLSLSHDSGKTWSEAKVIIDEAEVDDRNVAITALADDRLLLIYNTYTKDKKFQAMGCHSSDQGTTWTTPKAIGPTETATRAAAVMLSDGSLLLPFYFAPGNGALAARSTDMGFSWKTIPIPSAENFVGDEWDLLEISPGRILGIIRSRHRIFWKTESLDFGETWSIPKPTNVECKRANAPPHLAMQQGRPTLFYPDDRLVSNSAVNSDDPNFLKWNIDSRLPLYLYNSDRSVIRDGSYISSVPVTETRRLVVDYEIREDSKRITGYYVDFPKSWGRLDGAKTQLFSADSDVVDIGSRRELFVDEFLIERRDAVEVRLHPPTRREIVLVHDAPWEGSGTAYHTIFRDGDIIRMYYRASDRSVEDGTKWESRPSYVCYAESKDGLHWVKPEVGLIEFDGSKKNNIVWTAPKLDNFTPFKDDNPECRPGEKYKSVTRGLHPKGLRALKSADGIHWSPLGDKPIITQGDFDTQNNAFWDPQRKHYWCYIRDLHDGIRDIRVSTSTDFRQWSEPELLTYGDAPDEPLYTNQVQLYYRAPHLFVGFPMRYIERAWSPSFEFLPDLEHRKRRMKFHRRFGTAITDGLFMTSRDGRAFQRWDEAFLRPGPERKHNWLYGDGQQSLGLLEMRSADPHAPPELALYVIEDCSKRAVRLRRYTMRVDGFVSLHARQKRGEIVTRPLAFSGKELSLNFSTSAAGSVRVEIQDREGAPIPGLTLGDSDDLFGDTLDRVVSWKEKKDLTAISGKPVRIRMVMSDADVYSLQFRE